MSAKDKPVSKPANKNFRNNFDGIFNKQEAPFKKPAELGVSPSTEVINIDCTHDKEQWEGFTAKDKEDE
jgi:hypothetical protein